MASILLPKRKSSGQGKRLKPLTGCDWSFRDWKDFMINRLNPLCVPAVLIFVLCTLSFVLIPQAAWRSSSDSKQSSKDKVQSTKSEAGNSQDSARRQLNSESHLLEIGHASKMRTAKDSSSEFKVVSYNIRWRGG